jgi:hypothetical protein
MPLKAKKYLVTTRKREIFVVRQNAQRGFRADCAICRRETEMLSVDEAVSRSARSAREIFRQTEAKNLHSMETADGHLFVCRDSLNDFFKDR